MDYDALMYIIIAGFLLTDMTAVSFIHASRKKLDTSHPEDAAKDRGYKLVITILLAQALVVPIFLLFVVKPLLISS